MSKISLYAVAFRFLFNLFQLFIINENVMRKLDSQTHDVLVLSNTFFITNISVSTLLIAEVKEDKCSLLKSLELNS